MEVHWRNWYLRLEFRQEKRFDQFNQLHKWCSAELLCFQKSCISKSELRDKRCYWQGCAIANLAGFPWFCELGAKCNDQKSNLLAQRPAGRAILLRRGPGAGEGWQQNLSCYLDKVVGSIVVYVSVIGSVQIVWNVVWYILVSLFSCIYQY